MLVLSVVGVCRLQQASRQNFLPAAVRCDSHRRDLDKIFNSHHPSKSQRCTHYSTIWQWHSLCMLSACWHKVRNMQSGPQKSNNR